MIQSGLVLLLSLLMAPPLMAQGRLHRFDAADRPRLVDCGGQVCFRFILNGRDESGQPVEVAIDRPFELAESGQPYPVFAVMSDAAGTTASSPVPSFSLILLDTSGSMRAPLVGGRTRFQAATAAIRNYVSGLRPGSSRVAIVPFNSRGVVAGVRATGFDEPVNALSRLAAIERTEPDPTANTGLYSAVDAALAHLTPFREQGHVQLIVFTDGANDVNAARGDDPDLLGDEGLALVQSRINTAGVEVITIGFGSAGSVAFNESALRALAWPASNFSMAGNERELAERFTRAVQSLTTRVQLTAGPVRSSRDTLAGRTLAFTVSQRQPDGSVVASDILSYAAPAGVIPSAESSLTEAEAAHFRVAADVGHALLRRVAVLLGFSTLLLLLWFGVPRVVWPQRYASVPAVGAVGGPVSHRSGTAGATIRRTAKPTQRVTLPPDGRRVVTTDPNPNARARTPGPVTPPVPRRDHSTDGNET